MPVIDREKEREIVIEGRRQNKSDEFIKSAVLRFRERATPVVEAKPDEKPILQRAAGGVGGIFKEGAEEITEVIKEGAEKIGPAENVPQLFSQVSNLLRTGLRTTGVVAETAIRPIAEPIAVGIEAISEKISESERVQKFATNPIVSRALDQINESLIGVTTSFEKFKEENPEKAKDVESAAEIVLLLIGEKPTQDILRRSIANSQKASQTVSEIAKERIAPEIGRQAGRGVAGLERGVEARRLQESIEITKPKLTTKQTAAAIAEGRGIGGGLKTPTIKPSKRDLDVARAVSDVVTKKRGPFKNIKAIEAKIEKIAKGTEQVLKRNNTIFNLKQLESALKTAKEDSRVLFGTEKTLENTYDAVIDEFIKVASKNKKNLSDLWESRKQFDRIIDRKFPNVLSNPAGDNIRRNAVLDVRRAVNDFIADSLPKDNPFKTELRSMSNMFTGIKNIADNAAGIIDKDLVTRAFDVVKKHPIASTFGGTGIGLAIGGGLLHTVLGNPFLLGSIIAGGVGFKVGKTLFKSEAVRRGLIQFLKEAEKRLTPEEVLSIQRLINQIDGATMKGLVDKVNADGITFNLLTKSSPKKGFAVSIPNATFKKADRVNKKDIIDFIKNNKELLLDEKSGFHVGGWTDGGEVFLDMSVLTNTERVAKTLGEKFNQRAVFDIKNNKEIRTGGTGDSISISSNEILETIKKHKKTL